MNQIQPILPSLIRQTHLVLVGKLLVLEVILAVLYISFRLSKFLISPYLSPELFMDLSIASLVVFFVLTLLEMMLVVSVILIWSNDYYLIGQSAVIHRRGIFHLKEETYSLENIEAITVEQGFIGKVLDFGTIQFYSPVLRQQYYLHNIPHPLKLKEQIEAVIATTREEGGGEKIIPIRG